MATAMPSPLNTLSCASPFYQLAKQLRVQDCSVSLCYKIIKANGGIKNRFTWKMTSASFYPKGHLLGNSFMKHKKLISTPLSVLGNLNSVILETIFHFNVKN